MRVVCDVLCRVVAGWMMLQEAKAKRLVVNVYFCWGRKSTNPRESTCSCHACYQGFVSHVEFEYEVDDSFAQPG